MAPLPGWQMNSIEPSRRSRLISLLSAGGDCDLPDACVDYVPGFLPPKTADGVFDSLIKQVQWRQPKIKLFGKTFLSPRLSAWYGDACAVYSYSGLVNQPLPWLPVLQVLRRRLKNEWAWNPNAVLVNWYRDGQDSMGWHSDDESELGNEPTIASISLGASRRFLLRHKKHKHMPIYELVLEHGSLLIMAGSTQKFWRHSVPKSTHAVGQRVNLTFRLVKKNARNFLE